MVVFGTEMELATFIYTSIEVILWPVQLFYVLSRPQEKQRKYYLILLTLLIFYNLAGGFFPDQHIHFIGVRLQNILAYLTGFAVACFIPYYFYKVYNLENLRWLVRYGILFFIVIPFLISFTVVYAINGDLDRARTMSVIIPFIYVFAFNFVIWREVINKLKKNFNKQNRIDAIIVCLAVIPWSTMPVMAYFNVSQILEESVSNSGFLIITVLFLRQGIQAARSEYTIYQEMSYGLSPEKRFKQNCELFKLSPRETEIAVLLEKGLTYKGIAERLFISERTIGKHVQNIYEKVGVSNKQMLLNRLLEIKAK